MSTLAGTGAMVRLALRRDRVRLPLWVVGIVALLMSSVASVTSLYASDAERASYTSAVGSNPVAVIMGGPGAGLPSLGGVVVFEVAVVGYVAVGLMSVLLVVRHTRSEEEAGRTELLRAGAVGRHAGPVAALLVVTTANLAVGAVMAVGLVGYGLPSAGSLALASSTAAFGLVMAAVAALTAQVTEHARGASGAAAASLGGFFALRAAGDVGNGALSWASPMGWALATRPFAQERWVALLLPLVLGGALVVTALALVDRRDVGAGLTPARAGRARASRWLSGTIGLALRQHRASLAGWGVGLFLLGVAYGSVGDAVEELVSDNEGLAEFIGGSGAQLMDSFFVVAASMIALLASGFALQVATRMRAEEEAGRLEPLLATALPRWRWATSHLLVAVLGSTLLLALSGLGLGLAHGALTADSSQVGRLTAATLIHAPAVWVLVGVAAALFGLVPRAAAAAWAVLAASVVGVLLSTTLRLPDWAVDLTPFHHVPQVPLEGVALTPVVTLTAVAAGLVTVGLVGLNHRDVT